MLQTRNNKNGHEMLEAGYPLIFLLFWIVVSITPGLAAEKEVQMTFDGFYGVRHIQPNENINQKDVNRDQGGVKLGLLITPIFQMDSDINYDYRLSANIIKRFESDYADIYFEEAFVDFLFKEKVGLKTGLSIINYGSNSYFNPLQVVEFVPEIRERYGRQFFGNTDLGYQGVPSLQGRLKFSFWDDELYLNLRQSEIFLGVDISSKSGNVAINSSQSIEEEEPLKSKVFSVTDLNIIYKNLDINILSGYIKNKKPVWGAAISYLFPLQILAYAEVLYRKESFRPRIIEGGYTEWQSGSFYNAALGASVSFVEPIFKNSVQLKAELFYYGEGLNGDSYRDVRNFFDYKDNYQYYSKLIRYERNFIRNGMLSLSYTIPKYRLTFVEKLVMSSYTTSEVGPRYRYLVGNEFTVVKSFDAASISLGYLHNSSQASDSFIYQDNDKSMMFIVSLVL